ncbi:uncharacterized protein TRIADDRAFT_28654 [Trichoplax adhaerens]|uniref:Phosphatidylinositol-3,4,5-trisphosphate 3-phosphatase n=1 Tax=Trichoplax adhaerens TaxID=10228 RepID=B3S4N1_TRIAD|nr:hypothetical protein TRIADDRAFT_28654 [Trichoplax adhaerens]EDV22661.1 hypothetical protein TRIADDRAFT_28654 [Trichoplax adhaerens]|eukprot:XP_002115205.1 hypothetical protein TRIADDRAFT_28654 [Trichoplax adhaerens]
MLNIKKTVSKNKRRYRDDDFDLDLSYIKPTIIAMGFPSDKLEGVYRNHIDEVIRFFDTKHKQHYKIYNLCNERTYDPDRFFNRVATYAFEDHNAPPFALIQPFCDDVDEWLKKDEKNIVAVHCKAGKACGRTGVMISCYLLYANFFDDTNDALNFYGQARTLDAKGVTIPSQRRYVEYYGYSLRHKLIYKQRPLLMNGIIIETVPNISNGTCCPFFTVRQHNVKLITSKVMEVLRKGNERITFVLDKPLPICGDVKIEFFHKSEYFSKKSRMFHFWFNTFFVVQFAKNNNDHTDRENVCGQVKIVQAIGDTCHSLIFKKEEIDQSHKDTKNKTFSPEFKVGISYTLFTDCL